MSWNADNMEEGEVKPPPPDATPKWGADKNTTDW